MLGIEHLYLSGTVRMHTLMVEELTFHKKIDSLEELGCLRMRYHRHIEQSVIWHSIRSLSISCSIAYTHRHHSTLDNIRIDFHMHLIVQTLEYHQDEGTEKRQGT